MREKLGADCTLWLNQYGMRAYAFPAGLWAADALICSIIDKGIKKITNKWCLLFLKNLNHSPVCPEYNRSYRAFLSSIVFFIFVLKFLFFSVCVQLFGFCSLSFLANLAKSTYFLTVSFPLQPGTDLYWVSFQITCM